MRGLQTPQKSASGFQKITCSLLKHAFKVKFDFRVYFAITNLQPLRVWIHRKGFSRLTTKEFSVTGSAATDLQRHVANIHFQTQYPESYTFTKSRFDDCRGSCRSLQCVLHEMSKRTGTYITLRDLLNEVGKDPLRDQERNILIDAGFNLSEINLESYSNTFFGDCFPRD